MASKKLTEKELGLISDLLTYEQWAMKKSGMYAGVLTEPALKDLCKSLETNHSKNFQNLYNYLNAQ
ncbi:MAG: hypothetical protein WC292_03075 [Clostridia bacterium]